ncbi:hypothetical protein SmJEL517_g06007 [Synchytrium microbalum]|uniref:Leucine-rich repeat-containing N-terminal plant-type domain-containing protein n=1 Tax=Synchytrium microbalum TaxID=1806994 RepID=A0A507BXJ1_9FUNG|nr:uncharacterized protein SmJEL517_g06007 [Synchytrium microbalum]TPX30446.1 hypothetical protein SmJEL517_g06007 [Synchytrium microbalum]
MITSRSLLIPASLLLFSSLTHGLDIPADIVTQCNAAYTFFSELGVSQIPWQIGSDQCCSYTGDKWPYASPTNSNSSMPLVGCTFQQGVKYIWALQATNVPGCHGTFFPSLNAFPWLEWLNIQNCQLLSVNIPFESIGSSVSALRFLILSGLGMTGSITDDLANNLFRVEQVDLSNNMLSGSIPDSMGSISTLRDLDLHNNSLSGSVPSSFARLSNLMIMELQQNQISGSLPDLYSLPLTQCSLAGNDVCLETNVMVPNACGSIKSCISAGSATGGSANSVTIGVALGVSIPVVAVALVSVLVAVVVLDKKRGQKAINRESIVAQKTAEIPLHHYERAFPPPAPGRT